MYVNRFEQRSLAWAMMDIALPYLTPEDRSWLCVKIGAGDLESALITLVGIGMRHGVPVPVNISAALHEWLRGYSGTEVAAAFEPYVGVMPADKGIGAGGSMSEDLRANCDRFGSRPRRVAPESTPPGSLWGTESKRIGQR
jgi:hypothetical protein